MGVEVGEQAPDFALRNQHREVVTLSGFRGDRSVLVVFYPFSFTGVCTGELAALRDALPTFEAANAQVLAISCDTVYTQRVFADQQGLQFPLLSDFWPHGAVAEAYGVFDDKLGAAVRGTFIIDKSGVVRWKVVNPLPDARDVGDYAKVFAEL